MSPSIYNGCVVDDQVQEAVSEFKKSLEEARAEAESALAVLSPLLSALSSAKTKASTTIGDSSKDNEVKWEAIEEGQDGNQIMIFYDYLGPMWDGASFQARPASSYVDADNPTHIHCILAVDATADVDPSFPVNLSLPIWLTDPAVQALVIGTLAVTGMGTGLPEPTPGTQLTGGKGSPLPDSEAEANSIARVFGKTNYQDLLREYNIPVIEDSTSARAYLEQTGEGYVVVGERILLVAGENLVGIRALYNALDDDLTKLREHLATMAEVVGQQLLYLVTTRNIELPRTEIVCGEPQEFVEIKEEYIATDSNVPALAEISNTNVQSHNNYIFWSVYLSPSTQNNQRLVTFGIPEEYYEAIFSGVAAEQSDTLLVQAPDVYTIEDPTLITNLQLTNVQIEELLAKEDVLGVKIPSETSIDELVTATNKMLSSTRDNLANGLSSRVKAPIAVAQGVNLEETFQDKDRSKELATRGKACARQPSFLNQLPGVNLPDIPDFNLPDVNLPDIDFPDLPNPAKQIESLFGGISSAVNAAVDTFDSIWKAAKTLISPVLNKVQNLNSLAENMFDGALGQCALGVGQELTGFPELGAGGVSPVGGGLGAGITPSIGGIPVPLDLFQKFMAELSGQLNETVTSAFANVMQAISKPICMAQKLLSSMTGTDTGSEINPCKEGTDPDDTCPPAGVQEIVNASEELTETMESLPQLEGVPSSSTVDEKFQEVEKFTGRVNEFGVTSEQEITRGIKETVDELWKSFETKLTMLDTFDAAIQSMAGDVQGTALTGTENQQQQQGCSPPSVGFFSDTITSLL